MRYLGGAKDEPLFGLAFPVELFDTCLDCHRELLHLLFLTPLVCLVFLDEVMLSVDVAELVAQLDHIGAFLDEREDSSSVVLRPKLDQAYPVVVLDMLVKDAQQGLPRHTLAPWVTKAELVDQENEVS